jgi:hypothetical protein
MGMLFMFLGVLMLISDWFFPVMNVAQLAMVYSLTFPIRLMGLVFVFIGIIIIAIRLIPTGVGMFMEMPSERWVPLIHSRVRGKYPDAKFMRGKRVDLEVIRAKNKVFKDMGGGFRIGGHSCRRTYETIGFTVPDWISEYFNKIKKKYGLRNSDEFREIRKGLLALNIDRLVEEELADGTVIERKASKEEQLRDIPLLESVMNDPEKRRDLLNMDWRELRCLEERLFDGISHNGEEVELFIDSATPNEQDILERQTFINEMNRERNYRDPGDMNIGKWLGPIIIIILIGAIAAIMIQGAFGN